MSRGAGGRDASRFLELIAAEGGFGEDLEGRGESLDERVSVVVDLGRRRGFDFTADDLLTLFRQAGVAGEEELPDETLERISGGIQGIGPKILRGFWTDLVGSKLIGETEKNLGRLPDDLGR